MFKLPPLKSAIQTAPPHHLKVSRVSPKLKQVATDLNEPTIDHAVQHARSLDWVGRSQIPQRDDSLTLIVDQESCLQVFGMNRKLENYFCTAGVGAPTM